MIRWITSRIRLALLTKHRRRTESALLRSEEIVRRLDRRKKELRALERKVVMLSETIVEDIADVERSEKQMITALETEREMRQLYEDFTVPTLVAQHKLVLARLEQDTAIAVRNQTLAQITRGEEQ